MDAGRLSTRLTVLKSSYINITTYSNLFSTAFEYQMSVTEYCQGSSLELARLPSVSRNRFEFSSIALTHLSHLLSHLSGPQHRAYPFILILFHPHPR